MNAYSESAEDLLGKLEVEASRGLSSGEAEKRLEEHGPNRLEEKKKTPLVLRFLKQFADPMIIILLIAAVISFVVALNGHDAKEFFEPFLIVAIVVANAIMGLTQESKAEKALEALKGMSAPHARVIRDGQEGLIEAEKVVPGDIVLVEAGDFIPADGRLLESASLRSEESALTGESVPSEKDWQADVPDNAPIGDRLNMVYSGCSIAYGRGRYVVTSTGMKSEMGKIAGILNAEKGGMTPLQVKLARLSKILGIGAIGICILIAILGVVFGMAPLEIMMTAVSLAVSAIPEGLPAIVTIVLAIGVQRMVKKNAIIRSLPAVETLGSASIICSDKTGTLTMNRMTLVSAYMAQTDVQEDIGNDNSNDIKKLLLYSTLCTDGSVIEENGERKQLGDPTETAIIVAALDNKIDKNELLERFPRKAELPFDSDRKLMSVVCDIGGKLTVITKGAADQLIPHCVKGDVESGARIADEMSEKALRVLAVAYKEIDEMPAEIGSISIEDGLEFMGIVGMIDPPRPEVREAVKVCRKAGIKPVMITGDHVVTAKAIARDLGIYNDGDMSVNGEALGKMRDEELNSNVDKISVYARVSPQDKIRIVKAWQNRGEVVAMTGDGVNDAPALKAADIGCAMGITGTDVAKGAADMILTDDNFTTIVDSVREGRGIYANIQKAVGFLLGTNIGEILTVLISMLIWKTSPLVSMQLLWINLVTDSLPAIALGRETVEKDIMEYKPRPKNESIFAHGMGSQVVIQGFMFAALTIAGFAMGYNWGGGVNLDGGRTMAFLVLALSQVFHAYNMRSKHSLFKIGPFSNSFLNKAALISIVLVALVVFIPPVAGAFALASLAPVQYLIALGLALVPIPALEFAKAVGIVKPEKSGK